MWCIVLHPLGQYIFIPFEPYGSLTQLSNLQLVTSLSGLFTISREFQQSGLIDLVVRIQVSCEKQNSTLSYEFKGNLSYHRYCSCLLHERSR